MSTIQTSSKVVHFESGLSVSGSSTRTTAEDVFTSNVIEVLDVDKPVDLGDVITPRTIMVRNLGGDDLLVGMADGDYPFRLANEESMVFGLDVEGRQEVSEITCVAAEDLAEDMEVAGKYFTIYDRALPVRVWFKVYEGNFQPVISGANRFIEVVLDENLTAAAVAIALAAAIDADPEFNATVAGNKVVVRSVHTGVRSVITKNTATALTVARLQEGSASPEVHMESVGRTVVVVGVVPN